jgi:hypothetical protein
LPLRTARQTLESWGENGLSCKHLQTIIDNLKNIKDIKNLSRIEGSVEGLGFLTIKSCCFGITLLC